MREQTDGSGEESEGMVRLKGDIPYFETSAKEDHNVDTAFLCIARLALEHEHDQDIYFKTVAEQVPDTEQTSGLLARSPSHFLEGWNYVDVTVYNKLTDLMTAV
ncbi:Ras-related protein Rab7 [Zea mays]|uniref:Ras-related protein Rab7 n=1 Tax=Zea mays TaxID=4577 RepID=A0A3L6DET7_MAIZE|nr:Ras-related protein Rab7 [Zea mays]